MDKKELLRNNLDLLMVRVMVNFVEVDKAVLAQLIAMKCVQVYVKQKTLQEIKSGFDAMEEKGVAVKEANYVVEVLFSKKECYKSHRHLVKQFLKKMVLKEVVEGSRKVESLEEKSLARMLGWFGLEQRHFEEVVVKEGEMRLEYEALIGHGRIALSWESFAYVESGWGDMMKLHHHSKCLLCGEFPQGVGQRHLCLLCGDILCSFECQKKKFDKATGNLGS